MDITVAHRPWPQNARARPVRMRIPARRYRISGELMIEGSATACRFGSDYKKTGRAFFDFVGGLRLSAPEHVVRALGDFPDGAFIEDPAAEDVLADVQVVVAQDVDDRGDADRVADDGDRPQGELRDDVLPHLLVRDAGEGRLDVRRLLERHHEAIRQLAPDLVRDAGRSLVDEGQDEVELPRLAGQATERVRVGRDLGTEELVGLLEEQHEPRILLVPLRVQLEQPAGKDVRDEQVDHLVRPVIAEVEDDALPVADRPEDVGERILGLRHRPQEREPIEPADPPLQALERHLMGPLRSEHLHRRVLHGGDEVPASAALRDLVQRVDHGRGEVLQRDDEVFRRDLPGVEDERLGLAVLRVQGEDLDLPGEEELQALRLIGRAEHAVLAVHVEDQDGSDVLREDSGADELVQDRLARAGPTEDRERLLDELLHVELHVERLDAGDGAERRRRVRDFVDPLHVVPRRMSTRGKVRRNRLRLAEPLRLPVHELDHSELRLAVADPAALPFLGLRSRHDHVGNRRAGELVCDVALFVQDVLDQAIEIVPCPLDDDGERDLQFFRVSELKLRDQAVDHGCGDDLADLHRRSLATLSRYSWNALRFLPSTCVSPSRIVRTSSPIRSAIFITVSWYTGFNWRTVTAIRCASMRGHGYPTHTRLLPYADSCPNASSGRSRNVPRSTRNHFLARGCNRA